MKQTEKTVTDQPGSDEAAWNRYYERRKREILEGDIDPAHFYTIDQLRKIARGGPLRPARPQ